MCYLRVNLYFALMRTGTRSSSSDWTFHVFCRHKIVPLLTSHQHQQVPELIDLLRLERTFHHLRLNFLCMYSLYLPAHPVSKHCGSWVVSHFMNWINSGFILIRQIKEKCMQLKSKMRPRWWSNWDICRIAHVEQRYNSQSLWVAVMDAEAHL